MEKHPKYIVSGPVNESGNCGRSRTGSADGDIKYEEFKCGDNSRHRGSRIQFTEAV